MAKTPANAAAAQPAAETDDEKTALFGGLTDEQRAEMTDEELAGIDGDDDGFDDDGEGDDAGADAGAEGDDDGEADPEGENDKSKEGEEGTDGDEGEEAEAGEGEGGEENADADAGADPADADATGEGEAGDDDDEEVDDLDITRSVMPNEWQIPKDADETLKGLNQQAVELAEKFDAGDLSAREYHQQREELDDKRYTLRTQISNGQQAWQKALGDWQNRTVPAFLREHKQYGPKQNETLNRMLDAEVRALQLKTNDPFNPRILRQAHANIQAAMGNPAAAADQQRKPADSGKTPPAGKTKTPVVQGKKPQVPPTLAKVPADEIDDTEGGRFARLDRLSSKDPHAFEEAMMKMSSKDRAAYDEYLAGA